MKVLVNGVEKNVSELSVRLICSGRWTTVKAVQIGEKGVVNCRFDSEGQPTQEEMKEVIEFLKTIGIRLIDESPLVCKSLEEEARATRRLLGGGQG